MPDTVDPKQCPLCGGANDCQVALGRGTCWCFAQPIPATVLEKIPDEARDLACVCRSCALGERDAPAASARLREILRGRG